MTWARNTHAELTLEQKVGQVICYRASQHADATIDMARQGLVGAVSPVYYAGMRNLDKLIGFMNELQRVSPVPVLMLSNWAHDSPQWGGTPFPSSNSMMLLGAARRVDLARRFGQLAARETKALGIDLVWEPCVDVNTNPRNPIISTRAFSDRPQLVTEMAAAVVQGMQDERLIPNAKHFPGHGDTDFDTHVQLGVVGHDRARLDAVELYPYRELARAGLRGVMTAHLIFPALDETPGIPATFSRRAIHDVLRHGMNFQGLIVSDSLTMKAIKDNYPVSESVVRSFNAGHDMLLQDYNEPPMPTFEVLLGAVKSGEVPMAELDASVMRVLEAKQWAGMPQRAPVTRQALSQVFMRREHVAAAREMYEASVTVLEQGPLPLDASVGKSFCLIATRSDDEQANVTDMAMTVENSRDALLRECRARLADFAAHVLAEDPNPAEVDAAVTAARDAKVVLFATMPRIIAYKKLSGAVGRGQIALVEKLLAAGKMVIVGVFGAPFILIDFPRTQGCLTTYAADAWAVEAAVRVLFGEIPARGRLPITLPKAYPFGHGHSVVNA